MTRPKWFFSAISSFISWLRRVVNALSSWLSAFRNGCQDLGIQSVSLGEPAGGFGEIAPPGGD